MPAVTLPKPLSAYVGLVVATIGDAKGEGRSAAAQVAHLPLSAAGQLLTARHRYDELAEQGDFVVELVVNLVRQRLGSDGSDGDGSADWLNDEFSAASEATAQYAETFADELEDNAGFFEELDVIAPEAQPEPTPAPERATPMQQLEQFSVPAEIGAEAGGLKKAEDLPLEDFDHMSGPQLRGRLRKLDRVELVQLLDYERAHANRVGIILMLENRLTKLIEEQGPAA